MGIHDFKRHWKDDLTKWLIKNDFLHFYRKTRIFSLNGIIKPPE